MTTNMEIREWASDTGREVGERGRLPKSIKIEYLKAHPKEARTVALAKGLSVPARGRLPKDLFGKLV